MATRLKRSGSGFLRAEEWRRREWQAPRPFLARAPACHSGFRCGHGARDSIGDVYGVDVNKLDEGVSEASADDAKYAKYAAPMALQGAGIIGWVHQLANNLARVTGRHSVREIWLDEVAYQLVYTELLRQSCVTKDANPQDGKCSIGVITINHHTGPIKVRQAE